MNGRVNHNTNTFKTVYIDIGRPRKWFGSADFDTKYSIYLSFWAQTADLNPFRGTHCICIYV